MTYTNPHNTQASHRRRPTITYPATGPYRSRHCVSKSSEPVKPWSNPRRSPYCSRRRDEDYFAYEANTTQEREEAEKQADLDDKEDYLEDAIPPRFRRQGMFGKFWINPNATNRSVRDPHYYRFPEGLPKCGFRNCTHTHDLKKPGSGDDDEGHSYSYKGSTWPRHYNYGEVTNRRGSDRRTGGWDALKEQSVGVLAYDEEGYPEDGKSKDTS